MKKPPSLLTKLRPYLPYVLLAMVIGLAIIFRFWKLDVLPPGLHPDEAANGIDIFRILERHDWRIIYDTNGPREALFFYIQAGFVAAFGNTMLALRLAPALFGVLAVVMVYLLGKELFGRRAGLIAAFLMAVNPWVVIISRDGFRASLVPFFVATVLYTAVRAYRSGKWYWYVLAGVSFGLGFYTYTAYGALLLALVAALAFCALWRRAWLRANLRSLALAAVAVVITIAPLVITIVGNPGGSTARAGGTSFLNNDLNGGQPVQTLASSVAKTVLQYNLAGDQNARHNIPVEPLLNTFVGIMLLVGLLVACYNIRQLRYVVVLVTLGAMLIPAGISAESLPHALRSIGTAVPVFLLCGIGINYMLVRWYQTFPLNTPARLVGLYIVVFLLLLTAVQGAKGYFWAWGQDPRTYAAYDEDMAAVAQYLNAHPAHNTYFIEGGYSALPVEYLTHNKSEYQLVDFAQARDLPLNDTPKRLIIPVGDAAAEEMELLKTKFPANTIEPVTSNFSGKVLFYVFQTN